MSQEMLWALKSYLPSCWEPKLEKLLARLEQSARAVGVREHRGGMKQKTWQKQLKSGKPEQFQAGVREESSWFDSGFSRWRCPGSAVCSKESAMPATLSAMAQSTAALQGKSSCQVNLSMQAQQMSSLPGTEGLIFLGFPGTSWAQVVTELTPAPSPRVQVLPEHPPALRFCCFLAGELEWGIFIGIPIHLMWFCCWQPKASSRIQNTSEEWAEKMWFYNSFSWALSLMLEMQTFLRRWWLCVRKLTAHF